MTESEVQKFYKSCNIFITGGTGFLGKILIEKLLRSTDVATIYVLIREKKGKNVHCRLDEMFDDIIFDSLRKERPKFKYKIEVVSGDCSVSGLGLSLIDRQKLISCVDLVFHCAATVKFDENLKLAYTINVNATKEVVELCKQMKKIKSVMHVSTAFSNCHLQKIEEKFYDYHINYEEVGILLEKISKNEAEKLTPKIMGNWPNTYSFTKALAESLIRNTGNGLPIGVFRPAIVISTYKEPIAGWIDNIYGPTGVCAAVSSGILRVMKNEERAIADVVPVDTCVAALIVAAWDVGTKTCERTVENIPVYNYVSSVENPILWSEFSLFNYFHVCKYPLSNSIWTMHLTSTNNIILYNILIIFYHLLPAVLLDGFSLLTGKKPKLLKMYKKIHKLIDVISYFSLREWKFTNQNTQNLWKNLTEEDRTLFPLSIQSVNWFEYCKTYMKGMRRYLLKDPDSTLEAARQKAKRLKLIDFVFVMLIKILFVLVTWNLLMRIFS